MLSTEGAWNQLSMQWTASGDIWNGNKNFPYEVIINTNNCLQLSIIHQILSYEPHNEGECRETVSKTQVF